MTNTKPIACPTCRRPVDPTAEDLPFCSDRCRVIDLGRWASGDYKISSPIFDEELLEDLQCRQEPGPAKADDTASKWKN